MVNYFYNATRWQRGVKDYEGKPMVIKAILSSHLIFLRNLPIQLNSAATSAYSAFSISYTHNNTRKCQMIFRIFVKWKSQAMIIFSSYFWLLGTYTTDFDDPIWGRARLKPLWVWLWWAYTLIWHTHTHRNTCAYTQWMEN